MNQLDTSMKPDQGASIKPDRGTSRWRDPANPRFNNEPVCEFSDLLYKELGKECGVQLGYSLSRKGILSAVHGYDETLVLELTDESGSKIFVPRDKLACIEILKRE